MVAMVTNNEISEAALSDVTYISPAPHQISYADSPQPKYAPHLSSLLVSHTGLDYPSWRSNTPSHKRTLLNLPKVNNTPPRQNSNVKC